VYLGYAGPYSSSPSSAFGHLFLVVPSTTEEPVPLWDVVTFGAETDGAGPVRFVVVGIGGGFFGKYQRVAFHEKIHDYESLEDRDLWLVELTLSATQRAALTKELAETAGRWYPYTFFSENCAYYLQQLLSDATGVISEPKGVVSPIGVVDEVLSSTIAGPSFFRPSVSRRLRQMANTVDPQVVKRLRSQDWVHIAADTTWVRQLPASDRQFVQEYVGWRSLDQTSLLSAESSEGISFMRLLNARETSESIGPNARSPGRPSPDPLFHRYGRFGVSSLYGASSVSRVAVRYRAALHDLFDPSLAHRPVNSLDLLALEVSSPASRLRPRLDRFVLFSQRALSPSDWITPRRSWMLETLGRRGGIFSVDGFHLEVRGGAGKTRRIRHRGFAYWLITVAGAGVCCNRLGVAPGWETGFAWLSGKKWRSGVRWSREFGLGRASRVHERLRIWVRRDMTRLWALNAGFVKGPTGSYLQVTVDWYPFSQ
jgi:Domain of unknown function (DUF4105)